MAYDEVKSIIPVMEGRNGNIRVLSDQGRIITCIQVPGAESVSGGGLSFAVVRRSPFGTVAREVFAYEHGTIVHKNTFF